jgi:hypothetical protein
MEPHAASPRRLFQGQNGKPDLAEFVQSVKVADTGADDDDVVSGAVAGLRIFGLVCHESPTMKPIG